MARRQLGRIEKLPSPFTRSITLGRKNSTGGNYFHRDGLRILGLESFIRSNPRLIARSDRDKYPDVRETEKMNVSCAACEQLLADIYGYSDPTDAPTYRVVKIQTDDQSHADGHVKCFCWDCAASRQRMIESSREPHWQYYIAADGDDVFRFIEQTIFEDWLANEINEPRLALHSQKSQSFRRGERNVIGWRLLAIQKELSERGLREQTARLRKKVDQYRTNGVELSSNLSSMSGDSLPEPIQPTPTEANDQLTLRERRRVSRLDRPGQRLFRDQLINAYDGKCAFTGCDIREVLEAAHIIPYNEQEEMRVQNGLLLRADIHALFDAGLIAVDTESMAVLIAPDLEASMYGWLKGARVRRPRSAGDEPVREYLDQHRAYSSVREMDLHRA